MQRVNKKMRYIFGPVNSRRFGTSLGIDLSPDTKSCNYDCIYCELQGAKPVKEIKNPPKVKDIINEVKSYLDKNDKIDVITITSNGEPTLYKELDTLVDELNLIKKDKRLLILSNGSTICDKEIKKTLKKIDIVKLSLDCATQKCFKKIDRALDGIDIAKLSNCMIDFKKEFHNKFIIEILIVQGINDKNDEIKKINDILQLIKPDRVDMGTIDRPPAYQVKPISQDRLIELSTLIKNIPVSIIYKNRPKIKQDFNKDEIISLLSHRPQSQFDIDTFFSENSKKILKKLIAEKKVYKTIIAGVMFYRV